MNFEPYYSALTGAKGARVLSEDMNTAEPGRLFGELWRERELAVLFGAEGAGKSILAVQIADSISKGKPIEGFALDVEAQPVIYLDLSTPHRTFYRRYTAEGFEPYDFSDNFNRQYIPELFFDYNKFKSEFAKALDGEVKRHKAKVLVINCLESLKSLAGETFVIPLVKRLQSIYGLSVLLVCESKPNTAGKKMSLNHLSNRRLAGIADSVFALGKSNKEDGLRYLVQLKSGNGTIVFHENNTILLRLAKPTNFLGFQLAGFEEEYGHVAQKLSELEKSILNLQYNNPKLSYGNIANMLGTNKMKVKRTLSKHRDRMKFDPGNSAPDADSLKELEELDDSAFAEAAADEA